MLYVYIHIVCIYIYIHFTSTTHPRHIHNLFSTQPSTTRLPRTTGRPRTPKVGRGSTPYDRCPLVCFSKKTGHYTTTTTTVHPQPRLYTTTTTTTTHPRHIYDTTTPHPRHIHHSSTSIHLQSGHYFSLFRISQNFARESRAKYKVMKIQISHEGKTARRHLR